MGHQQRFSRRAFLGLGAAAASSVLLDSCAAPLRLLGSGARRPNVVFIFADDWGWGDLGCHGHPIFKTPNLDRLAAEGTDFHRFNVCNPVCSPSRVALMTGHYPARYCVHEHFARHDDNIQRGMPDWLDPNAPTLTRMFQRAGYRTGHFGKWHLTNDFIGDPPPVSAYGIDKSAVFNGPGERTDHVQCYDRAVDFIRASQNRPFFVNLWIHETHGPFVPSEKSLAQFKGLDERHRVYAATVADGDRGVGKVMAVLDELDLARDTIVIFSSDNGPEWTSPTLDIPPGYSAKASAYYCVGSTGGLRGRKRSLFEGGVRTPFIVRWPGRVPAGATNDTTALTAVDMVPTLCAAAGVALPVGYRPDGENMLPALEGQSTKRTRPIFWEWRGGGPEPDYWPRLAVTDGDWKLLMTYDRKRAELYNLATDRAEAHNVAAEHPDVVDRLARLALDWKATLPSQPDPACISKFLLQPAE